MVHFSLKEKHLFVESNKYNSAIQANKELDDDENLIWAFQKKENVEKHLSSFFLYT